MKELFNSISEQIRLRRRLVLVILALLPMIVLLAYNLQYQRITTTYTGQNGTIHSQHNIRRITSNDLSISETSSELKNNTNNSKNTNATREIRIPRLNDKAIERNTLPGENKNKSFNSSFTSKTSNETLHINHLLSNFELKKSVKETTSNISIRVDTKPKPKLKSFSHNDTELNNKTKTASKAITINQTKTMLLNRSRTSIGLKINKIINEAVAVDKAKGSIIKTTVSVRNDGLFSRTQIHDNPKVKTEAQNNTDSFSFKNPLIDIVSENFFEPYCSMFSNSFKYLIWPDSPSDFSDWTFKRKRKCPNFKIPDNINDTKRVKYTLNCVKNYTKLIPTFTHRSDDIQIVALDDPCLAAFTNSCCNDTRGIPNIVHYVWYFKNEMKFAMFTSILSVIRFVRPCLILFHGEYLPYGKYWDYIVRIYPNILHVYTIRPLSIFGKKILYHEHSGDIMRMNALMQLGGMYLDTDIIVFRDLEPLREYNITLCYQTTGYLLNGFIMAKKNATFLDLWMAGYKKDYRNDSYVYNSMFYNKDLANNRSDLIHIEVGTICSPHVSLGRPINSTMVYEWTKLYGFHLYARTINIPLNEVWIKNLNSSVGAMIRHIIYGNKELCEGPVHTFS